MVESSDEEDGSDSDDIGDLRSDDGSVVEKNRTSSSSSSSSTSARSNGSTSSLLARASVVASAKKGGKSSSSVRGSADAIDVQPSTRSSSRLAEATTSQGQPRPSYKVLMTPLTVPRH